METRRETREGCEWKQDEESYVPAVAARFAVPPRLAPAPSGVSPRPPAPSAG